MKKVLISLVTSIIILSGSISLTHATIINMDATVYNPVNHLLISLDPGTYTLDPVGTADGGLYDAWNAWGGAIAGCDGVGMNCIRGWSNYYEIYIPSTDTTFLNLPSTNYYVSEDLALSHAESYTFTITAADTIELYTHDSYSNDNRGGLSFNLVSAPEPVSSMLFCIGAVFLGGRRLYKKKQAS